MRITVLVTWGSAFGARGMYNRQEVGLARGLAQRGHTVEVLKAVRIGNAPLVEDLGERCTLIDIPTRMLGNNGMFEKRYKEELLRFKPELLIIFGDLQLCVPTVERWCRKHGIMYMPYVGSLLSHRPRRKILQAISQFRNGRIYRRNPVLAKSDAMAKEFREMGASPVGLMPVGLDTTDLRPPPSRPAVEAKEFWGLGDGPVIGFVGRMFPDKRAARLPELLVALRKRGDWTLILVGEGPLAEKVEAGFRTEGVWENVIWKQKLPNSEMWKLYCGCDVLVNLNPDEVLGMSILEGMYFETPIVAVRAPGPCMTVRDGLDGYLGSEDPDELAELAVKAYDNRVALGRAGRERVLSTFDWPSRAAAVEELVGLATSGKYPR